MAQGWLDANRPFDGCMDGFYVRDISSAELAKRLGLDVEEEVPQVEKPPVTVTHARAHTHEHPTSIHRRAPEMMVANLAWSTQCQ